MVSALTGFVLVWSTPAVFRIEGLSKCGLNVGTFDGKVMPFWRDSAARAVKKPTGGLCSVVLDESRVGGVPSGAFVLVVNLGLPGAIASPVAIASTGLCCSCGTWGARGS